VPAQQLGRFPVPRGTLISDFTQGGGGFGDPLDRPADAVADDVAHGVVSPERAELLYGVVLRADGQVDEPRTEAARAAVRTARRADSREPAPGPDLDVTSWTSLVRPHETLEIGQTGDGTTAIRCTRCGHLLCAADRDYKPYALRRDRDPADLAGRSMPDGSPYLAVFREYACPGCATLLAVDVWSTAVADADEDLWDVRLAVPA
jgi:N-methylhydantoinase B